jgi:hypothetical protein
VDGRVKRGHRVRTPFACLSTGITCPKIDFAASAASNRKLRDLLRSIICNWFPSEKIV